MSYIRSTLHISGLSLYIVQRYVPQSKYLHTPSPRSRNEYISFLRMLRQHDPHLSHTNKLHNHLQLLVLRYLNNECRNTRFIHISFNSVPLQLYHKTNAFSSTYDIQFNLSERFLRKNRSRYSRSGSARRWRDIILMCRNPSPGAAAWVLCRQIYPGTDRRRALLRRGYLPLFRPA